MAVFAHVRHESMLPQNPLSTTDTPMHEPYLIRRHFSHLSREGVSLIVDQTLAFLDAHKGCEDAFNALLAGLGNDTGVDPAAGIIRGLLEAFRASGNIFPHASGGGEAGGMLGVGTASLDLSFQFYGSNSSRGQGVESDFFFAMFLHEVTHTGEGPDGRGTYTDEAMYNFYQRQGIYTMTNQEFGLKSGRADNFSAFAGSGTDLACIGYSGTILTK